MSARLSLTSLRTATPNGLPRRTPRLAASSLTSRSFSTSISRSNPATSPATPSSSSTPRDGPSATTMFYRALLPSMLHCLALGSIVYYALELVYMTLAREREVERLGQRVEGLEKELEVARSAKRGKGSEEALSESPSSKTWWKFW